MTLAIVGQCPNKHPELKNRCTLKRGHRGACRLDLGPGALGVRTEEYLRSLSGISETFWRRAMARGLTDEEKETLRLRVKEFHLNRDPVGKQTEIR